MTQEDDLEKIEELVNKGISLQREGKHQDAITHFDEAICIDKSLGGESDPNLLLLKNNSSMKLWLKINFFDVEAFFQILSTVCCVKIWYPYHSKSYIPNWLFLGTKTLI